MRVIWWKITRPETNGGPIELTGETLNIHLPENQSPLQLLQDGEQHLDRDWLNRLLQWANGSD